MGTRKRGGVSPALSEVSVASTLAPDATPPEPWSRLMVGVSAVFVVFLLAVIVLIGADEPAIMKEFSWWSWLFHVPFYAAYAAWWAGPSITIALGFFGIVPLLAQSVVVIVLASALFLFDPHIVDDDLARDGVTVGVVMAGHIVLHILPVFADIGWYSHNRKLVRLAFRAYGLDALTLFYFALAPIWFGGAYLAIVDYRKVYDSSMPAWCAARPLHFGGLPSLRGARRRFVIVIGALTAWATTAVLLGISLADEDPVVQAADALRSGPDTRWRSAFTPAAGSR